MVQVWAEPVLRALMRVLHLVPGLSADGVSWGWGWTSPNREHPERVCLSQRLLRAQGVWGAVDLGFSGSPLALH